MPSEPPPNPAARAGEEHSPTTEPTAGVSREQPREASDTTPGDEPRTSASPGAEATPVSGADRRNARPRRAVTEDTLLSVPLPLEGAENEVDERVDDLERRMEDLLERVAALEEQRTLPETVASPGRGWLLWVAFLLVLAVLWQLGQRLR